VEWSPSPRSRTRRDRECKPAADDLRLRSAHRHQTVAAHLVRCRADAQRCRNRPAVRHDFEPGGPPSTVEGHRVGLGLACLTTFCKALLRDPDTRDLRVAAAGSPPVLRPMRDCGSAGQAGHPPDSLVVEHRWSSPPSPRLASAAVRSTSSRSFAPQLLGLISGCTTALARASEPVRHACRSAANAVVLSPAARPLDLLPSAPARRNSHRRSRATTCRAAGLDARGRRCSRPLPGSISTSRLGELHGDSTVGVETPTMPSRDGLHRHTHHEL